jgi:hypothetical protein
MMRILNMFDAITRTEATPSAFRYEKEGEAENDESLKLYELE